MGLQIGDCRLQVEMLIADRIPDGNDRRPRIEQRAAPDEISCFVECNMRACG